MGFSKLETAVLDALADELCDQLPDLPGQIAEARHGVRRNTGSGFSTEIIVDRNRPAPDSALTGRLGTIHGDVPGLVEPMAFQVELTGGLLLALHGMTYDEPTDLIDFPTSRVTGLFRIDAQGNSVSVVSRAEAEPPVMPAQAAVWDGSSPNITQSGRLSEADSHRASVALASHPSPAALDALFGKRFDPGDATHLASDLPSDAILIACAIGVFALIGLMAVFLFELPIFAVLILFGYAVNLLRRPGLRATLRKVAAAIRAEGRT